MSRTSLETTIAALKGELSGVQDTDKEGDQKTCTSWMGYQADAGVPAMPMNERISLRAMIAYVSHYTSQPEFKIEQELSDRFGVPNIHCLSSEKYEQVISLLADQVAEVA